MALILKDRISETTTTAGTGTLTLGGALSGFQPFSSIGNTNTTYYCITDGAAWEVGLGTYSTSGDTLARTTVLSNSNGNTSPITLAAGTKTVFSVYPAERAIVVDGATIQIPNSAVLPLANGGTGSSTAAFSGSNITDLNATAITAGTISNTRTTASSSNGASSIVERDATGNFSTNVITANSYSGSGANLTSLNASSVSSGTLAVANGGTGSSTAAFSGANITSLNASSVSSGTLSAANGGTGQTSLTANNVILGNATSAVQFVAPGTASNVLTSNGSTWVSQAAGGGGGGSFVFLTSATAANSVVDFTGLDTSTYDSFFIIYTDVRGNGFNCRLYPGGTLSTSGIYGFGNYRIDGSGLVTTNVFTYGVTSINIDQLNATSANLGRTGYLYLHPANGYSNITTQNMGLQGATVGQGQYSCGYINSASAANGIRFMNQSLTNLTAGTFRLYGIKAS